MTQKLLITKNTIGHRIAFNNEQSSYRTPNRIIVCLILSKKKRKDNLRSRWSSVKPRSAYKKERYIGLILFTYILFI